MNEKLNSNAFTSDIEEGIGYWRLLKKPTMAQNSSRLEALQARFQQKQMQKKEQKLLQLYDQQQQRAYQVVQRGSAGSPGSLSQVQCVMKTTTTTHTSSTSQRGKVRQMFDERRQTTGKGIDRSYPLEPLDNKPKRQIIASNGHVLSEPHQNNNLVRQSVTVKRTARADMNSNINGGKPIVSYHEEVSQESFGNGNRRGEYHDEGDSSPDRNGVYIEEMFNNDTIEKNRMLAKIHLMEYDENLRHRVNNDLNSEQFPEDLMVDVPEKLPRKPITRKQLSPAEARLERFKNANSKRSTTNVTTTVNRSETRKRSEPMFPSARTITRDPKTKSKPTETVKARRSTIQPSPSPSPTQSPRTTARKPSTPYSTKPVKLNSTGVSLKSAVTTSTVASVRTVKSTDPETVPMVKSVTEFPKPSPRVQKSPSPDPAGKKLQNSTAKAPTRRSFSTSPTRSVDEATRQASAGSQRREPTPVRKSSQGTPKSQKPAGTANPSTPLEGSYNTSTVDPSHRDNRSESQTQGEDRKSLTPSPTASKKKFQSAGISIDGDSKEKEAAAIRRTTPTKSSAERSTTPQNQRHSSLTTSTSPRPPSDLSTASSTTTSARSPSSADSQSRKMATKERTPTRSPKVTSNTRGSSSVRNSPTALGSDTLVSCKTCGRRFAQDRVSLHEKICAKTGQKKRKQFDAVLHRVQGTELEAFAKKGGPTGRQAERRSKKPEVKAKSNWRRKHEDFINAIRSAKQVQAHLAAGGKLSDLPPPPASDTSDYIQCPHCGRKFSHGAAERHIPKCATMMHNKPNPRAPPKPKR